MRCYYTLRIVVALLLCSATLFPVESKTVKTDDSSEFVNITDVVPDVILEIRYYSTYNFVGERIDGYLEPTALLTRQAADSLRAVSDDL